MLVGIVHRTIKQYRRYRTIPCIQMSEFNAAILESNSSVGITIEIDNREGELSILLLQMVLLTEFNGLVRVVTKPLPIGDIILYDDQGTEMCIMERKTPADLAASIRDGRYAEQSYRLNECTVHNHNIIYLIEGNVLAYRPPYTKSRNSSKNTSITAATLVSTLTSLQFYKGFSVAQTSSMTGTCEYILGVARKFGKEGVRRRQFWYKNGPDANINSPALQTSSNPSSPVAYSDVMHHRVKKNNITVANITEIMLSQIPGVSPGIAKIVANQYSGIEQLIGALRANPQCLGGLTRNTKTGKQVKISSTSIKNITEFLLDGAEIQLVAA